LHPLSPASCNTCVFVCVCGRRFGCAGVPSPHTTSTSTHTQLLRHTAAASISQPASIQWGEDGRLHTVNPFPEVTGSATAPEPAARSSVAPSALTRDAPRAVGRADRYDGSTAGRAGASHSQGGPLAATFPTAGVWGASAPHGPTAASAATAAPPPAPAVLSMRGLKGLQAARLEAMLVCACVCVCLSVFVCVCLFVCVCVW
jgi:hypothetical protein